MGVVPCWAAEARTLPRWSTTPERWIQTRANRNRPTEHPSTRPPERAADTMNAEGASEPTVIHRRIQKREVRRMEDGVAQPSDHGDGGKAHEGMGDRYQGEGTGDGREAT